MGEAGGKLHKRYPLTLTEIGLEGIFYPHKLYTAYTQPLHSPKLGQNHNIVIQ